MKNALVLYLLLAIGIVRCKAPQASYKYDTDILKITQVSENVFVHTSFLETEKWGKVGCNGMVITSDKKAIIFDTPVSDSASKQLIDYISKTLNSNPIAIVATHFHKDCLGGLRAFHDDNIPSYATAQTIGLAEQDSVIHIPQNTIKQYREWKLGKETVIADYCGEGHTSDNIVGYFPSEKVLFGGCLVKSLGANKGNLSDANTTKWSKTIRTVKNKYSEAHIVIPGHGDPGGPDLLDYTEQMFEEKP